MRIVHESEHKSRIELAPHEISTLDKAHEIVAERAEKERGKYNDGMLEWCMLGMLRAGKTTDEILEWARTAPFQQGRSVRGYG